MINTLNKTKFCRGISDISDSYMGFIVDQWGVLHNGEEVYPGVVDCLKELKSRKKHVIILSNSGKRAEINKERLKKLGIGPSLYDEILTSGEMTWQGLEAQDEGFFQGLGKKVFVISRGNDRTIVDGLDVEVVEDASDADFMIISGSDAPEKTLEDYEADLKKAVRKGLTALCANPDSLGVMGNQSIIGAGTIARRYQDFGGVVHYIGKPHKPIFQECMKRLQVKDIYPGQTIVIGDSMTHDIMGGHLVNIDTCLVRTGLHSSAFKGIKEPKDVDKALTMLSKQYNNIMPKFMVGELEWGDPLPDRKHKKRKVF